MEELQLTVSSACAMHNMPVYQLTGVKNVLIHHLFVSCMNRTTKYVLDFKHHMQVTGDRHECFWSGGCSQDMAFHISVSVNTHNSIIWSTENSHVLWIWSVKSKSMVGNTARCNSYLFYFIFLLRRHCEGHHTRTCFTILLCHSWNQKTWI